MGLAAGTLDRRFEVQKPVRTQSASGEVTIAWTRVCDRWGSLRGVSSSERVAGERQQGDVTHEVVMRQPGLAITHDWRLVSCGRTFSVQSVRDPDDRRDMWLVDCVELIDP